MNAGYVRLSRDDDRRNYVSIENQKLIIRQFAADRGVVIHRWYEDDGVSGYLFDRPGFGRLMEDLDKDIDEVYVKDFSRLGRHNAKVLLLLDEFQERGKRLIVIDDNYDSQNSSDDTIGIKTWFNERYVKDTSKKIRRALAARQKEGTLITRPPFGYRRDAANNHLLEIVPEEAAYIRQIFALYLSGFGYRKIAVYLTDQHVPTPSMAQHARELATGRVTKRPVAEAWSESMVRELLENDFYTGTLRLRKRARTTVHGRDRRVPDSEQYVFEKHHPAIIEQSDFSLVQELKRKRSRSAYRGSPGPIEAGAPSPFGSCLFCRDCGRRLTPIRRKTADSERKYYICAAYNAKGRRGCEKAHLIEESDLAEAVLQYLRLCRAGLEKEIAAYQAENFEENQKAAQEAKKALGFAAEQKEAQLKLLFQQKLRDLSAAPENRALIDEAYECLQRDLLAQLAGLRQRLSESAALEAAPLESAPENALDALDRLIAKGKLDRRDVEQIIERIDVDKNGVPEITLKYGISHLLRFPPASELNRQTHAVLALVMNRILREKREYTSAKYLLEGLAALGFPHTRKSLLPYLELLKAMGVLEDTQNPRKPYAIVKTKAEIAALADGLCPASILAACFSGDGLHGSGADRRHASDGL